MDLFEPDVLLPAHHRPALQRTRIAEPERRLMLAVLENAVDSYRKHALARDSRSQVCFREAEQWFVSEDHSWPFAFENICDFLDMNAAHIRGGLERWRLVFALAAAARENGTGPLVTARSM